MSDADGTRPAEPAATGPVPAPAPSAPLFAAPSSYRHVARPAAADAPVAHAAPDPFAHPGYAPVPPATAPGHASPVPLGPPAPGGAAAAPQVVRRRRRRTLSVAWVAPLVVLALVAGVGGGVLGARLLPDDARPADAALPTVAVPGGTGAPVDRAPDSVAGIAAGVLPSVVSIEVRTPDGEGSGSGFVLREDGYVLTNNHVVAGADSGSLVVVFGDGSELPGTVVGATGEYDLAVVKVEASGLTPLVLGDSDAVVVGDPVVAVGAPLGLVGTVTTGIVSARNRPVVAGDSSDAAFINAIQTDAAINPGNSGGPLVNAAGEVVGINSAIAQLPGRLTSAGSIGLGFAIPSNQARRTAEQLIETGRATYPVIGVLLDNEYSGEGVRVFEQDPDGQSAVTPDGPADAAGIRRGDVILAIDGRPVTASEELIVAIRAHRPGDTVVLRVRTGESERDVRVRLDEAPSD
ncbi:trypsin-like peptidase domain-containing protein [Cellulomonas iranensis]|uniref:S1C family serine protease n=1 Tax=Cellulomonas iranensis TaxID=76862 RepID=UPI001CF4C51A|nr:trypsin-like peptidase domain-containing protein [Cellulomonas iranensis]UCN13871.1 trypsin-like peptidase domain-containing protein [Cellulomonas iranensis]